MSPNTSSEVPDLARSFDGWREERHSALIPYLTAGYPEPDATLALLRRLAGAGADVIELGVPFSDPLADGPTIQRASQQALERGATLDATLQMLARFRETGDTPVIIFTYLNPLLSYGLDEFIDAAVDVGADGVLVTDLPLGGDAGLEDALADSPLALIRLIAPTTPPERARAITGDAQGFVYYISRTGVTGARTDIRADLARELDALREVAKVPVAVGFGISTPEQASVVAGVADGVVVGSALIDALDRDGAGGAEAFVRSLRRAMDGGMDD